MNSLKLSLLQTSLEWDNPAANQESIAVAIKKEKPDTDIIVLPEMFTTGFSMDTSNAEEFEGSETVSWMKGIANEFDAAICGSVKMKANGKFINRMLWVEPNGTIQVYDKQQLFTFAGEDQHYTAGDKELIVEWRGWKVKLLVCYDLRFPELARNREGGSYPKQDLLIYVANWPEARSAAWHSLLVARAIENQCYLAGCNRVGEDGNGISYDGKSSIIDSKGVEMAHAVHETTWLHSELSLEELNNFRKKFPVLKDARL
ncbi:MAG: amidohydrolase [Flavobacteriales bacterium]|nr:amidohydrolase [Flavobacteriales bacterium]